MLILLSLSFEHDCLICGFINPKSLTNPKPPKPSLIKFQIDDVFTYLLIDDKYYPDTMTQLEKEIWFILPIITLDLYAGNKITLAGFDNLGRQGMLVTIQFYNATGVLKEYNSGIGWTCDDKPAYVMETNSNGTRWEESTFISPDANWIWTEERSPIQVDVTCSFTIPLDA